MKNLLFILFLCIALTPSLFSEAVRLSSFVPLASLDTSSPEVARDSAGNATITWLQQKKGGDGLFFSVLLASTWNAEEKRWSEITQVSPISSSLGNASSPTVAIDGRGTTFLAFVQKTNEKGSFFNQIYVATKPLKGNWTTPELISQFQAGQREEALLPTIAVNAKGDALLCYQQKSITAAQGFQFMIYAAVKPATAPHWLAPSKLSEAILNQWQGASNADCAIDSSGTLLVTWQQITQSSLGNHPMIFLSQGDLAAHWTKALPITSLVSGSLLDATNPEVTLSDSGFAKALVTYQQNTFIKASRTFFTQIYVKIIPSNPKKKEKTVLLSFDDTSHQSATSPQLAQSSSGAAVISWQQDTLVSSSFINAVFVKTMDSSGNLSKATQLSPFDVQHLAASTPAVASSNGFATVSWVQSTLSVNGRAFVPAIYLSQNRGPGGSWTTGERLSSLALESFQLAQTPQVAIGADGGALVTWNQSELLDNSFYPMTFYFLQ